MFEGVTLLILSRVGDGSEEYSLLWRRLEEYSSVNLINDGSWREHTHAAHLQQLGLQGQKLREEDAKSFEIEINSSEF